MVEIKVLGPIRGFRDGTEVDLGGPTQRRLLAALAARPDEIIPVTTLLDDLWGDEPPPSGPQSIQSYISRLRRNLGAETIQTKAPGYRLRTNELALDSSEFLAVARSLPDDPEDKLETIQVALGLWSGPPFEGFDHVDFASRQLNETRFDLIEQRSFLLSDLGRHHEAVAILEEITKAEPLRETAWIALSKVLLSAGRQAEALRVLDRYRESLVDIGLEPGPAFTSAQEEAFEAPTATTPTRSQLPRMPTAFVGRENEVARLRELIDSTRLVTVTGPGGMGKSRLAVEALAGMPDLSLAVVRLANLAADKEVAPAVLTALGGEARGSPLEAVVARLSRSPTMLLLDNAEHVIEGVAELVSLILTRTGATLLITSREPLNVLGETVMSLEPLDPSSAVQLFRERATRVNPDFDSPAATLDILCEELDYMPLAIEMAAARAKALDPKEILTRLSRRYGLLDKPLRGGTGRHRSLDALVDWSYNLLTAVEKLVFERLSVISSTFDVELATAVAGFEGVYPDEVPGALASLVEKSLVLRTPDGNYRILRVLKSYARQQLAGGADERAARTSHSRWFAALAAEIGDGLITPDETLWIARANDALEDLSASLAWSVEVGDFDSAGMILEGLFDWFYHRHPPAIIDWGDLVLSRASGHDVFAVASAWSAVAAIKTGDLETARQTATSGTVVEGPAARFAWFMTGDVACYQDRLEDARDAFRKQIVRASAVDDQIGVIDGVAGETIALSFQGRFDQAIELADDLTRLTKDIGAPTYKAYAQYASGEAIIEIDPARSADLLEEAADLAASVNNQFIQAMARTTRGSVLAQLERFDEAVADLHDAAELWDGLAVPSYRWAVVQYLGAVLAQLGSLDEASRLLAAAEHAGRKPFKAGQAHWLAVVDELSESEEHERWQAEGASMTLEEATTLALTASRPAIPQHR